MFSTIYNYFFPQEPEQEQKSLGIFSTGTISLECDSTARTNGIYFNGQQQLNNPKHNDFRFVVVTQYDGRKAIELQSYSTTSKTYKTLQRWCGLLPGN